MISRTEPRAGGPLARRRRASLAALLAVLCAATAAAEDDAGRLYAGAGLAVADFSSDHGGIGYSASPLGWQLYGGLQARERMAVELAVERLARIEPGDRLGSGIERLRISSSHASVAVRGVFSLSLEDVLRRRQRITLFATVGLARSVEDRDVVELTSARATSLKERDDGLALGVGATFDVRRVRLRAHVQSFDGSSADVTSAGLAAEFRF